MYIFVCTKGIRLLRVKRHRGTKGAMFLRVKSEEGFKCSEAASLLRMDTICTYMNIYIYIY